MTRGETLYATIAAFVGLATGICLGFGLAEALHHLDLADAQALVGEAQPHRSALNIAAPPL